MGALDDDYLSNFWYSQNTNIYNIISHSKCEYVLVQKLTLAWNGSPCLGAMHGSIEHYKHSMEILENI